MSCEEARLSLGAHALGALDPDEAMELDTHLATCEACTVELMELSGLTDFLAKVSERDVELVTRPPRRVLDRLLDDRVKRRKRGRVLFAVAASVAVLAVGGTVWSTIQQQVVGGSTTAAAPQSQQEKAADSPSQRVMAEPAPTETAAAKAEADTASMGPGLTFKGKGDKVSAIVTATPGAQNTAVTVSVTGVKVGTRCTLTVVSKTGIAAAVTSWTITLEDYERESAFPGKTTIAVPDIARFDLYDADGKKLLSAKPVHGE